MPHLLFSYSLYHANTSDYEGILTRLRLRFKSNQPDVFLNNPEYLLFKPTEQDWQKEIFALIKDLKEFINAEIQTLRTNGSHAHVVYRFGILEMESALFQFPPDLEDDDDE